MGSYIPISEEERRQMLDAIGVASVDELFADIPAEMAVDKLELPEGCSQLETSRFMEGLAAENHVFGSIFRGAGAYWHYIPAIVGSVVNKEEFVTAYTPYQAEISQGVLQSIFEFQTMICDLTGMDAANASVYDGASAAAEAVAMCRDRKRNKALVAEGANPMVIDAIKTYCFGNNSQMQIVPNCDGRLDMEALDRMLDDTVSCVYLQQPSFFGTIEEAEAIGEKTRQAGAKFIMGINPIAAALLKSAGECNADIAVGEGQPLGMPLSFGGPYLGFMAAKSDMMRKLPGRIVGQTVDAEGRRAFVLTLQAREQHIRREKASSNICSNQNLCALTASVYLAAMGNEGLMQAAKNCYANAHYLAERLAEIGYKQTFDAPFFHEFPTRTPVPAKKALEALEAHDILGGLELPCGCILWCATEMNDKHQIDELLDVLREVKC